MLSLFSPSGVIALAMLHEKEKVSIPPTTFPYQYRDKLSSQEKTCYLTRKTIRTLERCCSVLALLLFVSNYLSSSIWSCLSTNPSSGERKTLMLRRNPLLFKFCFTYNMDLLLRVLCTYANKQPLTFPRLLQFWRVSSMFFSFSYLFFFAFTSSLIIVLIILNPLLTGSYQRFV